MSNLKTVLIDSNRLSREGLLAILARGDISVIREASTIDDLPRDTASEPAPELILIDCSADRSRARQDLEQLREWHPKAKIVVLSASEEAGFLIECFGAPIDGLISKNVSSQALLKSLQLILAGERVFPSQLVGLLLENGRQRPAPAPRLQPGGPPLSEREIEIVQCLIGGDSNKAIANRLHVTEATVKVHLKSILRKIQARNRTQAAIWAINNGMRASELDRPVTAEGPVGGQSGSAARH